MTTHLYETPQTETDPPGEERIRIETRPTVQTWLPGNPVIPGKVWCWSHRAWEKLSDHEETK